MAAGKETPLEQAVASASPQVRNVVETWQKRYGLDLTSIGADSSRALEISLKRGVPDGVRKALFKALAEQDPRSAIKLEIESYERRGITVSQQAKNHALRLTSIIVEPDNPQKQLDAYHEASLELKKAVEAQVRARQVPKPAIKAGEKRYLVKPGTGVVSPTRGELIENRGIASREAGISREIDHQMEMARKAGPRPLTTPNELEGQGYWRSLDLGQVQITIGGNSLTAKAALEQCGKITDPQEKARMFREIVTELGRKFQVDDRYKEGEEHYNSLGIRYDEASSDPAKTASKKTFNCFSSSIVFGQIAAYAAAMAGIKPNEIESGVVLVSGYTNPSKGGRWEDKGHAFLRMRISGVQLDLDFTNISLNKTEVESITIAEAARQAKVQDAMFRKAVMDDETMSRIPGLSPILLTYGVANMTEEQRKAFFHKVGLGGITGIQNPAIRFRLAAIAAVTLSSSETALSERFGKLALNSLDDAFRAGNIQGIPIGSFLGTMTRLMGFMERNSDETRAMVTSLMPMHIWSYLYFVAERAAEMSPSDAKSAMGFLSSFYERNRSVLGSLGEERGQNRALVMIAQTLLELAYRSGSMDSGFERTMDIVYEDLGIDRKAAIAAIRSNAFYSAGSKKEDKAGRMALMQLKSGRYELERSFLSTAYILSQGKSPVESISAFSVNASSEIKRVSAIALTQMFGNKTQLSASFTQGRLMATIAKEKGLI